MKPIEWRKLQEATADLSKALGSYYKSLRKDGFSRYQAMDLVKIFYIHSLAANMIKQKDNE